MEDDDLKFELFKRACEEVLPHPRFQIHTLEYYAGGPTLTCHYIIDNIEKWIALPVCDLTFSIELIRIEIGKIEK